MTIPLTLTAYQQTKKKLAQMEARLTALEERNDLEPVHKMEAARSYKEMIAQYRRDVKLYEATHPATTSSLEG
jgi:hypothetical protein